MNAHLTVENLEVWYIQKDSRLKIVDTISFSLQKGEVLTLVGESGAGKSTCGKAMMGMLPLSAQITSGMLRIGETKPINLADPNIDWQLLRGKRIAMIYQDARLALNPVKTIRQHFQSTLTYHKIGTKAFIEQKAIEVLCLLRFEDPVRVMASYPFELSGGMCQRVYIALVLCLQPEVLIADEPTSALDTVSQKEVLALLHHVRKHFSVPILLITHDIGSAVELGGRIMILKNGKIIESGDTKEVVLNPKHQYTRALLEARMLPVKNMPPQSQRKEPLLQIKGLWKSFKKGSSVFTVLKDVNLALYKGETVGLLGYSGCGKSTLAKCIAGLERPDKGHILYRGTDITHLATGERKRLCKHIQMVFQDARASLNPQRSALQLVQEPLCYQNIGNKKERIEKARYYLQHVGLDSLVHNRRPPQLSTGQCQRIALARALIVEPDILICDEAVSALDMILQKQILCLLDSLQQSFGFTVIMISHEIRIIQHYCNIAAVMQNGSITTTTTEDGTLCTVSTLI